MGVDDRFYVVFCEHTSLVEQHELCVHSIHR